MKAARKAGHAAAVDLGAESLQGLAAVNLSNMENYDFVSGLAEVRDAPLSGPVINSRRQLWSVAGYLSFVQDIVFGLETSREGIRFRPFITAHMRSTTFRRSDVIELRGFQYLETRHDVRIHLPAGSASLSGAYAVERTVLNGKPVAESFVSPKELHPENQWDLYLVQAGPEKGTVHRVDVRNDRALYGPPQPEWEGEGISVENGKVVLRFTRPAEGAVLNIYRAGRLIAEGISKNRWTDETADDPASISHSYTLEAVDLQSGNASHLAPFRRWTNEAFRQVIPAREMKNTGGRLACGHHFADWGHPGDELLTRAFEVGRDGRYMVRAEYACGLPINTGITCGIKYVQLLQSGTGEADGGYLIMPHTGSWQHWALSSPVCVLLKAGRKYRLRIAENGSTLNMSYLAKNRSYTALPGGGDAVFNIVDIASVRLERLSDQLK